MNESLNGFNTPDIVLNKVLSPTQVTSGLPQGAVEDHLAYTYHSVMPHSLPGFKQRYTLSHYIRSKSHCRVTQLEGSTRNWLEIVNAPGHNSNGEREVALFGFKGALLREMFPGQNSFYYAFRVRTNGDATPLGIYLYRGNAHPGETDPSSFLPVDMVAGYDQYFEMCLQISADGAMTLSLGRGGELFFTVSVGNLSELNWLAFGQPINDPVDTPKGFYITDMVYSTGLGTSNVLMMIKGPCTVHTVPLTQVSSTLNESTNQYITPYSSITTTGEAQYKPVLPEGFPTADTIMMTAEFNVICNGGRNSVFEAGFNAQNSLRDTMVMLNNRQGMPRVNTLHHYLNYNIDTTPVDDYRIKIGTYVTSNY